LTNAAAPVGGTIADGFTVSAEDVAVLPLYDPVIVTEVDTVTVAVGTLNVCELEPAATVTLAVGNAALEPVSVTAAPPLGAAADSFTVIFTLPPPVTEEGETVTDDSATGSKFTVAFAEELPNVAVTVTGCDDETLPAVIVNVPEVEPAATLTEAGVVRSALLSES
jgi:hypothetical protein